MALGESQRHLMRMNDLYQTARRAHADEEISAAERQADPLAERQTFRQIDAEDPHLSEMGREYEHVLAEHSLGHIPLAEARRRVLDLHYTDAAGHTSVIDTAHSGRSARFRVEAPTPTSPAGTAPSPASDGRRPLTHMLVALGLAVALAAIPIGYLAAHRSSSTTANPLIPGAHSGNLDPWSTSPAEASGAVATVPIELPAAAITIQDTSIDEIPFDTEVVFGHSVLGRPLVMERRGEAGGVRVLVIGVIHGNEQAGLGVVELLRSMDLGPGVDLWLVPMMNPDGVAADTRQNANRVDLNRNFPSHWRALGEPGSWEYSGEAAGSEPEVRATMALAELITPDFVVWYHQDYFRISPGSGRTGEIRSRYAELVDLPLLTIVGGTYTGTAASWAASAVAPGGTSLTVEFGESLREGEAQANADAVLTVAGEFFGADSAMIP